MDTTLRDIRNNLTVAIVGLRAMLDGKLALDARNVQGAVTSLEELEDALQSLRPTLRDAVTAQEHMLAAVIEGSPYAKILVNRAGRIVLVNAQTEKLFGYSRNDLLGRTIDVLVPERFGPGHKALRDSFNAVPVARTMGAGRDLYGRRRDGSEVPIEIGLNPITAGAETYTLAAITDISERKRAEELRLLHSGVKQHATQLEELNRELASASRFKTQFVATMSHELRTPLTAIVGAAELLTTAKLDDRAVVGVQTIAEAAQSLLSLINSVLDFSKIEAGKIELQCATFNVEAVLEGTAEVLAQFARDKGVALYTYVDPTIPALQGDPDRLRQIVLNLIGNALKFTDQGRVVARAQQLERSSRDVLVRFEVQDSGIGIAADMQPRLFEPFVQAATGRQSAGTGLGLSIARRLVELMGGEIGVTSEYGQGSSFWFTARFAQAIDPPEPRRKAPAGVAGLIVTGDDTFAEIVERYMASWTMESRRMRSRDAVVAALLDAARTWVAIVDLDNLGADDIGVTIDILRAVLPARVIAIGNGGVLRKPIRQSYLFDAIVKAASTGAPTPPRDIVRPTPPPEPLSVGTVLVAEDNAQLQHLLKYQFEDLGVPVVFVSDGRQAVEAVLRDPYSLVLMDCQMPVMDGLTATRAIREAERTRGGHIPITAMTANAFSEDREACIAAGMDHYLAKPVRLADLRATIERWSQQPSL